MAECLGSINNPTLESITVKTGKSGKQWAQVLLGFPGNIEVRAVCFQGKNNNPITDLEAYVPGERLPNIFAKIGTDFKGDKVYTNMQILKVGTEVKDKSGFRVTGRITSVGKTQYANYIDVDTTDDEKYPSTVRLELPKDSDAAVYRVGQKLRDVSISPKGKFGTWTVTGLPEGSAAKPVVTEDDDDETPVAPVKSGRRNLDL